MTILTAHTTLVFNLSLKLYFITRGRLKWRLELVIETVSELFHIFVEFLVDQHRRKYK